MKLRSNKLDAMTFNSIADLKSFPSSRFSDGAVANVLGYYAPGDGGGGEFVLNLASVAADNGGTIIAPDAGSGRWERVWGNKTIYVDWFGPKKQSGNTVLLSSTHLSSQYVPIFGDVQVERDWVAVQSAIREALLTGSTDVEVALDGFYYCNKPINATDGTSGRLRIFGESSGGSSILCLHSESVGLDVTGKAECSFENWTLRTEEIAFGSTSSFSPEVGLLCSRKGPDQGVGTVQQSSGLHKGFNFTIRGHFSKACIAQLSSEENTWTACKFWNMAANSKAVICTGQNYESITTPFVDLPSDGGGNYRGGNTVHRYYACSFSAGLLPDDDPLNADTSEAFVFGSKLSEGSISVSRNIVFANCFWVGCNGKSAISIVDDGSVQDITIDGGISEWRGQYCFFVGGGDVSSLSRVTNISINGLRMLGESNSGRRIGTIYADDYSIVENCYLNTDSSGPYSFYRLNNSNFDRLDQASGFTVRETSNNIRFFPRFEIKLSSGSTIDTSGSNAYWDINGAGSGFNADDVDSNRLSGVESFYKMNNSASSSPRYVKRFDGSILNRSMEHFVNSRIFSTRPSSVEPVVDYESNFSAGTDGWTASNGVVDGNIDGIGGEDDTLRLTVDGTLSVHSCRINGELQSSRKYYITGRFYIPSSNSNLDGVRFLDSGGSGIDTTSTYDAPAKDTWVNFVASGTASGTGFLVYAKDGGAISFQDPGANDVIYLKDIKFTQQSVTPDLSKGSYVNINVDSEIELEAPLNSGNSDFLFDGFGVEMIIAFIQDATNPASVTFSSDYIVGSAVGISADTVTIKKFIKTNIGGTAKWVEFSDSGALSI